MPLVVGLPSHLDTLMLLMGASFDPRFGEAWNRAQLGGALAGEANFVRLLTDDGGAGVGFSLCRAAGPEVELLLVAVRPEARGGGAGGHLLDAAISDARARGALEMFLEVRDNNMAAHRLYRSRDFVEVGRRFEYYAVTGGCRYDALTMRRSLVLDH